jgi:hypothetical protein
MNSPGAMRRHRHDAPACKKFDRARNVPDRLEVVLQPSGKQDSKVGHGNPARLATHLAHETKPWKDRPTHSSCIRKTIRVMSDQS